MATPSTDSLAGLVDPSMIAKGEEARERLREEELKRISRDLSELLHVDKEEQVRWRARFSPVTKPDCCKWFKMHFALHSMAHSMVHAIR